MKRRHKNLIKNYKMPHLFRDELEKIELILTEANVKGYKIVTPDFEYEKVSEIPKDIKPLFELQIISSDPYMELNFSRNSARIFVGRNDLISQGIFSKIDQILTNSQRKTRWFFSQLGPFIGGASFTLLLIGLSFIKTKPNIGIIFLSLSFIGILWGIFSFRIDLNKFSIIEVIKRREKPSFLKRNKDQILLILLGAIIGSMITLLLKLLLK